MLDVVRRSLSDKSNLEDDSCVKITSAIDENENELIKWTNYLQLDSNSDENSDENYPSTRLISLGRYSSSKPSSDDENSSQLSYRCASSNNANITYMSSSSTSDAIEKRKRLDAGEKKLIYVDLDSRLLAWYREKRTAPGSTTASVSEIRKERATFRQLQCRGRQLSEELNHPCLSSRWFGRFLVRRRLSRQRPERQQKIPLDVFNMDESSLALFGDQSKRSINDEYTCNEVEGCLSNKVSAFFCFYHSQQISFIHLS